LLQYFQVQLGALQKADTWAVVATVITNFAYLVSIPPLFISCFYALFTDFPIQNKHFVLVVCWWCVGGNEMYAWHLPRVLFA
jgi:hypothetical protein